MIKYFEVCDILKIHSKVLELSGGLEGYKDKSGIEKVCDFVQNDLYYPEFLDKLTYIIFSISKNHFFNDGNKRTSIAVGAYFLIENGYDEKITEYIRDMEDLVIEFVENKINREDFKEKLKKYVWNKKK